MAKTLAVIVLALCTVVPAGARQPQARPTQQREAYD